jgi:hypothetical protein
MKIINERRNGEMKKKIMKIIENNGNMKMKSSMKVIMSM